MKAVELAKAYDPKEFEDRIYAAWQAEGYFAPVAPNGKKPFVMVMPPPNVTGVLHMGHGLNNSMPDILARFHRMCGEPTLWLPGTDHAGIATQHVVEKKLRAKGVERRELGREKFVEETWKVANEHHDVIKKQLEKIGSSCDWGRERFTLDEGLSKAVRDVFVTLYERGLVYKGEYLVNWCPSCGTALSDDEVEHADEAGAMYHIRYELVDPPAGGPAYIEIATTRPETLLGDTAVAYHPDDERYAALAGAMLRLPLADRTIPMVADAYVDRAFGTGLVKITPAHDPNDFEVGRRHDLPRVNILNPDGTLNDQCPAKYRGLKAKDARALVVEDLEALGLFVKKEPVTHSVGHCYRCRTVVEPFLSKQWFVKMRPLADKALAAWRNGEVRFYPQRWENTYENWLTNIRDWCISRQLWWGHRIPAWHCAHCGKTVVAREEPLECPFCKSTELTQDEDVLDTWFSSWLWPFSTLGWPEETADFRKFYPTTTLLTGFDIIFFWVARMIMAGLEFTGKVPFRDVCMTTLVRDKQGRKMSKSLGNGIDPLEIVDEYGADALKFTLAFLYTSTQDILINKDDFKLGSKFANKVWNASRYILMNLEGRELVASPALNDVDRWIYLRLSGAAAQIREALASYRFNDAAGAAYEFFWNDFCDWYLEATKLSTRSEDDGEKDRAVTVLLSVLEESLALLHPFLPFVTEEIYGKLPGAVGRLIVRPYPADEAARRDPALDARFSALKELVTIVRSLRSEFGIAPEKRLRVAARFDEGFDGGDFFRRNAELVALLAGASGVEFVESKPAGALALAGRGFEAYVYAREAVDFAQLAARFAKEAEKERSYVERTKAKLGNEAFVASAPADVVEKERQKLKDAEIRAAKLERYLADLA
ncbi:MAG: valine--tRNA ligase [Spirochaetes bacterium]|nr:valine--tRNA ligase [Spirochaetota bacterium]MBU1079832.1 valine--tRNA ligase [Spirochaetota bacterium]